MAGTMMTVGLTMVSSNRKTGPIPVSTSNKLTCPDSCPFKAKVCYASKGPLLLHWTKVSNGGGLVWSAFCDAISKLKRGQLWRHNQAGDLPGENERVDIEMLAELVKANRGKRGFTYTHKPLDLESEREAIRAANAEGFTINVSANSLQDADRAIDLEVGPVVCVLPAGVSGNVKLLTPLGRRVVVCPNTYRDNVTCASCGLCQVANRKVVVGFPVHGNGAKHYEA